MSKQDKNHFQDGEKIAKKKVSSVLDILDLNHTNFNMHLNLSLFIIPQQEPLKYKYIFLFRFI